MNNLTNTNEVASECFELKKPVFLVKINVEGLSKQRVDEMMSTISTYFKSDNANFWIIPIKNGDSDIKLIWGDDSYTNSNLISNVVNNNLDDESVLYEQFKKMGKFNDEQLMEIKFILRSAKLKKLLDESKEGII